MVCSTNTMQLCTWMVITWVMDLIVLAHKTSKSVSHIITTCCCSFLLQFMFWTPLHQFATYSFLCFTCFVMSYVVWGVWDFLVRDIPSFYFHFFCVFIFLLMFYLIMCEKKMVFWKCLAPLFSFGLNYICYEMYRIER